MLDSPWIAVREPEPDREYVVMVTHLALSRFRDLPRFMKSARAVNEQVRGARGSVGYATRARPFAKGFWTVSAWEDARSLKTFYETGA